MGSKVKKGHKLYISIFVISALIFGFKQAHSIDQQIRIAILKDVDQFLISARGTYQILDPLSKKVYIKSRRLKKSRVKGVKDGMAIGKNFYKLKRIHILTNKYLTIYSKNKKKRYRGFIEISIENNKLLVVNHLDLEKYVRGVLYHEVSDKWPMEAMKAQAVATRTYALFQIEENKDQKFDVTSDIYSQVYGGRSAERFRTNRAVSQTKGEVLTYKGNIIPTYFHSNSGGYTENVSELWKHNYPPLKGRVDEFANGAPSYHWKKNFRLKDIQNKLNNNGYKIGLIKNIRIKERNESGRIRTLVLDARNGKVIHISGKDFRQIIGPNLIKSNNYTIVMRGYFIDLIGKGWGHGVGMSQWGAHNMAKKRKQYKEILNYYYPGTRLKDAS